MGEDNVPAQLIRKVLYVGFFALLLNNFSSLADIIFRSFAGLGLKASAASLTAQDLMRPGFVADTGFTASRPLLDKAGELIGFTTFFNNFVTITVLMLAWLIVLLAFFVLAVQLFITIIEFKLTTLAGFVLVPFALFGKTAFLAERVLGNVITSGIKLMVLAIVVGIGSNIFGTIVTPASGTITLNHAVSTILAALAVFGLAIFVPGIAAGLVTGAPQLGAGAAVATTAGARRRGRRRRCTDTWRPRASAGRVAGGGVRAAASLTRNSRRGARAGRHAWRGPGHHRQARRRRIAGSALRASARRLSAGCRLRLSRHGAGIGRWRWCAPGGSSTQSADPPAWAQRLSRRQRLRDAAFVAGQAVREGDRPMAPASPDLKDDGTKG